MNKHVSAKIMFLLFWAFGSLAINTIHPMDPVYNNYGPCRVKVGSQVDPDFKAYVSAIRYSNQLNRGQSLLIDHPDLLRDQSSNALIVFFKNEKFRQLTSDNKFAPHLPNPFNYDVSQGRGRRDFIKLLKGLSDDDNSGFKSDFEHSLSHLMLLENPQFLFFKQLCVTDSDNNTIHLHRRRSDYPSQVSDYTFKFYNADESLEFRTLEGAINNLIKRPTEIYIELAAPCFVMDSNNSFFGLLELGVTAKINPNSNTVFCLSHRCFRRDNGFVSDERHNRAANMKSDGSSLCSGFKLFCKDMLHADKPLNEIVQEVLSGASGAYECVSNSNYIQSIKALQEDAHDRKVFISKLSQLSGSKFTLLAESKQLYAKILKNFSEYFPCAKNELALSAPIFLDAVQRSNNVDLATMILEQKQDLATLLQAIKKMNIMVEQIGDLINDLTDEQIAKIILTGKKQNNQDLVNEQVECVRALRKRHADMKQFCFDVNKDLIEPNLPEGSCFMSISVAAKTIVEKYTTATKNNSGKYLLKLFSNLVKMACNQGVEFMHVVDWLTTNQQFDSALRGYEKLVERFTNKKNTAIAYLRSFKGALLIKFIEECIILKGPQDYGLFWGQLSDWFNGNQAQTKLLTERLQKELMNTSRKIIDIQCCFQVNSDDLIKRAADAKRANELFVNVVCDEFECEELIESRNNEIIDLTQECNVIKHEYDEIIKKRVELELELKRVSNVLIKNEEELYKIQPKIDACSSEMDRMHVVVRATMQKVTDTDCSTYAMPDAVDPDVEKKLQQLGTSDALSYLGLLKKYIDHHKNLNAMRDGLMKYLQAYSAQFKNAQAEHAWLKQSHASYCAQEKSLKSSLLDCRSVLKSKEQSIPIQTKKLQSLTHTCAVYQGQKNDLNHQLCLSLSKEADLKKELAYWSKVEALYNVILHGEAKKNKDQ